MISNTDPRIRKEEAEDAYSWFWVILTFTFLLALAAFILAGITFARALDNTSASVCNALCVGPCTNGTNGINGTSGSSGALDFAEFYATMPTDNPVNVLVGADVQFPTTGLAFPSTGIVPFSPTIFVISDPGVYDVSYFVSVTEPAQLALALFGTPIANSVSGRATGTNYVVDRQLVTISTPSSFLSVRNVGTTLIHITPGAGAPPPPSSHPVTAHITIVRLS